MFSSEEKRTSVEYAHVGKRVMLVPYCKAHVPKYHEWMLNFENLELTASEPLTLEEEYSMQCRWMFERDKITFIVLSREGYTGGMGIEAMVGDVNLFLGQDGIEVEVMIGNPEYRRRGYGFEAVDMMLRIVAMRFTSLENGFFVAKIKRDNEASICLFSRMGFEKWCVKEIFDEIWMRFPVVGFRKANVDGIVSIYWDGEMGIESDYFRLRLV